MDQGLSMEWILIGNYIVLILFWGAVRQVNRNLCAINDRIERIALYVERIWAESDLIERHISGREEDGPHLRGFKGDK